jgi:MerR family transcriptional regulator, heat shock protein HspR
LLISEAARRVGVHPATLRRWHAKGLISPQLDVNRARVFSIADLVRLRELAGTAGQGGGGGVRRADHG